MTIDEARDFLRRAGVFYYSADEEPEADEYPDPEDRRRAAQTLNQNDTWGWAVAWGEYVPDADLPEVARLFFTYGWCGVLYWVSQRNGNMRSEFEDVNRFVDFVCNEERILDLQPEGSKRAYFKVAYTLGSAPG